MPGSKLIVLRPILICLWMTRCCCLLSIFHLFGNILTPCSCSKFLQNDDSDSIRSFIFVLSMVAWISSGSNGPSGHWFWLFSSSFCGSTTSWNPIVIMRLIMISDCTFNFQIVHPLTLPSWHGHSLTIIQSKHATAPTWGPSHTYNSDGWCLKKHNSTEVY